MSELARASAADPPDISWGELRHHLTVAVAAITQAARDVSAAVAAGQDPSGAAAMVALGAGVVQDLAAVARLRDVREAVRDEEDCRAAWPRPRHGLHAVT